MVVECMKQNQHTFGCLVKDSAYSEKMNRTRGRGQELIQEEEIKIMEVVIS